MSQKKPRQYMVCEDCAITVTDERNGSSSTFQLSDMEEDTKGTGLQLRGKDIAGLGFRVVMTAHKREAS